MKTPPKYPAQVYYNLQDDEIFVTILPPHFFALRGETQWCIHLGAL